MGIFDKEYSITDRMTVQEMSDMIGSQNQLTFDYIALCAVGAIIAAAGLLQDSPVTVVASMLVSPLMGPILSVAFGIRTGVATMWRKGLRNEIVGIFICFVVGFVAGISVGPFLSYSNTEDVPLEIRSRGTKETLIAGFFVAVASGVGVAIGVMQGGVSTLVGVAISAALLPPLVNCGLCFALHFNVNTSGTDFGKFYFRTMAFYSGMLFILNIVCIVLCANITFMVKKVNFVALAPISKSKERARSVPSGDFQFEDDGEEVSTYMAPSFKHRRGDRTNNATSSIVNTLMCGVDKGNVEEPLVQSRELSNQSSSGAKNGDDESL